MVLDLWFLIANLINIYVNVSTTKRVAHGVYGLLIASAVPSGK